jgi:ABC-type nitrate/sulfonate/bicarbonate transport system substrate-binding protein
LSNNKKFAIDSSYRLWEEAEPVRRIWIKVAAILLLCHAKGTVDAAENLRAASGGFTTAIHAVLWTAYEEKIFRKYGLDVEYLALNTGRLGMQMLLSDDVQILFPLGSPSSPLTYKRPIWRLSGEGLISFPLN